VGWLQPSCRPTRIGSTRQGAFYIFEHLVGENIYRYNKSLTSLECQASELANSDTRPRPTTDHNAMLTLGDRPMNRPCPLCALRRVCGNVTALPLFLEVLYYTSGHCTTTNSLRIHLCNRLAGRPASYAAPWSMDSTIVYV
jgi:hypothetical protein